LSQNLWQILISETYLGYEEIYLYVQWRDCTYQIERFYTSGASTRDLLLEWNASATGNTGSYMLSANDTLFVGNGLFVEPSAADLDFPEALFDYQIQFFDSTSFSFRVTENPQRRQTEGDIGTQNRIIE